MGNTGGFVRHHATQCAFTTSDSWVILNPIEQSIKRKIEAVGVPLKEWDIKINFGIKTGCNEAFIIDEAKRAELIAQDPKSAEIIRPILRGRDIKRYGYNWPHLYVITTFPARHYDIDEYPAVKNHLLTFDEKRLHDAGRDDIANSRELLSDFCHQRLEQSGKDIIINGRKIIIDGKIQKARKKTGNGWFETQDQIGYWEDFSQPKIVWGEISDRTKFCYDDRGKFFPEATTFFMTGKHLKYLLFILNSSLSEYLFSKIGTTTGVGTIRWKKFKIENLLVPCLTSERENELLKILENTSHGIECLICNFHSRSS